MSICPRQTTFFEANQLVPQQDFRLVIASETFQYTGSFKFRAAYQVARNVQSDHIIAASSGNFGQALAFACRQFGKRCTIVMPNTSARVKVDAVRSYGAEADLIDITKITRDARVQQLREEFPDAYISSAFDDLWVIAGNASLGSEIMDAFPEIESIVAPLGGGGLTSGIAMAVAEANHPVNVYGAEPADANDGARSFRSGRLLRNESEPQTIADGARTVSLGRRNWEILYNQHGLTDVLEVTDEAICASVRQLFLQLNLKSEPTGALAVAAVLSHPGRFKKGSLVCCIVSGGNVDPQIYAEILTGAR